MQDVMTMAVKDAGERSPLEITPPIIPVVRRDDGLVEDLAARQIGVQVDVGCQNEVLIVIFGAFAKQHQVLCCSNLVRVIRLSRPATILCLSWHAIKVQHHQQ